MDPNANLNEQLQIARNVLDQADTTVDDTLPEFDPADIYRLAELILALHEWRVSGGFDPYGGPSRVEAR